MKVLFLDFDGVLNNSYSGYSVNLSEEMIKHYELVKKTKRFIYNVLKKYPIVNDEEIYLNLTSVADIDYDKVQLLNKLVKETDCKIVFSTTWRSDGVEALAFYLSMNGFLYPEACIGRTGEVAGEIFSEGKTKKVDSCRGLEIKEWLDIASKNHENTYGTLESFVIFDDDSFDIEPFYSHEFIHVKGLTESDIEKAINILNNQK